jgi:hypothetical protein
LRAHAKNTWAPASRPTCSLRGGGVAQNFQRRRKEEGKLLAAAERKEMAALREEERRARVWRGDKGGEQVEEGWCGGGVVEDHCLTSFS